MTPRSPHDLNKYSDLFEELTGIYPLNVRGALATDGRDVVIFKIGEEDMIGARYHMSALPYIEISIPDELIRTVNVSYFVDTLLEAKYKNAKKIPNPLLEAALDPRAFEPKTWYASCFGVNDNGQTVLIGPYDEDELIQEAERRGAVRALRGVRARLVEQRTQISGEVAFSTIDDALLALRSHEYEECEEIQELPPEQEEEFPSALYKRIIARKQGLY